MSPSPVLRPVLSSQGYRILPFSRRWPSLPTPPTSDTATATATFVTHRSATFSVFSRVDSLPHFTSPAVTVFCRVAWSRSSFGGCSNRTCAGPRLPLLKSARRTPPALASKLHTFDATFRLFLRTFLPLVVLTQTVERTINSPTVRRPFDQTMDRQELNRDMCSVVFPIFSCAHYELPRRWSPHSRDSRRHHPDSAPDTTPYN